MSQAEAHTSPLLGTAELFAEANVCWLDLVPLPERLVLSNYTPITSLKDFSTSFNIELEPFTVI